MQEEIKSAQIKTSPTVSALLSPFFKKFKKNLNQKSGFQASKNSSRDFFKSLLKAIFTPPQLSKNIYGLDIGSSAIKLIQINRGKSGLELTDFFIEELPKGIQPGYEVVKEILKKLILKHKIQGNVVASIGGDTVNIQTIRIPFMPEEEIAKALRWEAQDELSIDLNSTSMDYIVLGEADKSGTRQFEVLLITVPKSVVAELVNSIRDIGLNPHAFEPPALAVVEAFGSDKLRKEGRVLGILDLGARLTNFSIVIDGSLRFTRNIPIASDLLTEEIASYCGVDKIKAENLKIEYGLSGFFDSQALDKLNQDTGALNEKLCVYQAVSFKIEKLINIIEHTFKSYLHQLSTLNITGFDKLILSGGGALIKDLDKILSSRFNIPVIVANPFERILIDSGKFDSVYIKRNAPRFTLAVGLALRKDGF